MSEASDYLELWLLCEEVSEQHQHVGGNHGHVGGVTIWAFGVAEAGAHGVVDKQHTGCLDLKQHTHTSNTHFMLISLSFSYFWSQKQKLLCFFVVFFYPARLPGLQVSVQRSNLLKVPKTTSWSTWSTLKTHQGHKNVTHTHTTAAAGNGTVLFFFFSFKNWNQNEISKEITNKLKTKTIFILIILTGDCQSSSVVSWLIVWQKTCRHANIMCQHDWLSIFGAMTCFLFCS